MKRAVLLCGALAMAATGCAMDLAAEDVDSTEQGIFSVNQSGLGEAVLIDFGADSTVTSVFVRLRVAIEQSPTIAAGSTLHLAINSVDGIAHFHGAADIPATDIVEVDREEGVLTGEVTWTEDGVAQVVNDLYTVCASLEIELGPNNMWYGPERCQDFGPFF